MNWTIFPVCPHLHPYFNPTCRLEFCEICRLSTGNKFPMLRLQTHYLGNDICLHRSHEYTSSQRSLTMAPAEATKGLHRNNKAYLWHILWQTPLTYSNNKCTFFRSRQSAVGVQTRLWAGRQEFRFLAASRDFSLLQNLLTGRGSHPARIQWAPWFPSAAKAVGAWGCPLTFIYCSTDCRCQESCFCRPVET